MTAQHQKAQLLRSLHDPAAPLALANAWDAASARLVEAAGAKAVATTSAGVAWGLGAADGNHLDRDRAVELIARVVDAVSVPVTADIESGFGATPADVADTVTRVVGAGAVGINIEDARTDGRVGLRPTEEQAERIAAARRAADDAGIPLYINARVDTYLRAVGPEDTRLKETLDRAAAYLRAGATGIFVPGVTDPAVVAALTEGIDAPVNILAGPGAPSVAELSELGVARVSLGSSVAEAAYAVVRKVAEELAATGTYGSLTGALEYGELNTLMS
ncbi:isocitrate lyase/phosphoenolpyruvate mutase family protein [Kitasatospora sp. DSM 101779]|uniref:isocitrate lyase/PEP mutase family protein n=1 Tax=Kitasatospora sp. DSM 101779 TaxID=2853165 RepID=UPI0021D83FC5|nr:isocitrate lyase/phosphoenolpyruvate mutase family protein [Kitasatospora sp. DSM 101779]MCU7821435.1 isocitrate lyase/phosphoenolpyruvate mutase family protein [Kitasatospora sp. DSM 101779]